MALANKTFTCSSCGRCYRMKDEYVGRELTCQCGTTLRVAGHEPAGSATTGGDEVRISEYAKAMWVRKQVERSLHEREDDARLSKWKEYYIPLMALVMGVVLEIVFLLRFLGQPSYMPGVILVSKAMQVLVLVPVLVFVLVKVAGWFDLTLGNLFSLLYKAAAIVLGPMAAVDVLFAYTFVLVDFDWWSVAVGYGYHLISSSWLVMILFDMSLLESAFVLGMNVLPRFGLIYLAVTYFPQWFSFG